MIDNVDIRHRTATYRCAPGMMFTKVFRVLWEHIVDNTRSTRVLPEKYLGYSG